MKKNIERWIRGVLVFAFLLSMICYPGFSIEIQESIDTKEESDIFIYQGDLVSLKVYSLTRIAVSNPGIVEIAKADVDEILLIGMKEGETSMYLWDELGKRMVVVRVFSENLDVIIARMKKLLENAEIEGIVFEKNNYEGKVVIKGIVPPDKGDAFTRIAEQFANKLLNYAKVEQNKDMIQIDAQFTELTSTLQKILGFDWNTGTEGITLPYKETLPTLDGSISDFFKIGDFRRTATIIATVNALLAEGKARILSKPSLVVINGAAASFMVGGEIPIRTTTTSAGGNVTENISFRSYGVDLSVTPTIFDQNKVDLSLNIAIRDIDAANAAAGVVAFTTKTATTKLLLEDGQTIVLAGFIKHHVGQTIRRIPFLSDIPVVGAFFRHKQFSPNNDQEVVVTLTPRIIRQKKSGEAQGTEEKEKQEAKLQEEKEMIAKEDATKEEGVSQAKMPEEATWTESKEVAEKKKEISKQPIEKAAEVEGKEVISEEEDTDLAQWDITKEEEQLSEDEEMEAAVRDEDVAEEELEQEAKEIAKLPIEEEIGKEAPPGEMSKAVEITKEEKDTTAVITSYVQAIQKKISRTISFPYEAKQKGWEGTVKLTLTILSDGTLNEVTIKESSGHKVFDADAMNTAQILAPFDPFPVEMDLEELIVTIPIIYRQEALEQNKGDNPSDNNLSSAKKEQKLPI